MLKGGLGEEGLPSDRVRASERGPCVSETATQDPSSRWAWCEGTGSRTPVSGSRPPPCNRMSASAAGAQSMDVDSPKYIVLRACDGTLDLAIDVRMVLPSILITTMLPEDRESGDGDG